jgi:hypothetical protein
MEVPLPIVIRRGYSAPEAPSGKIVPLDLASLSAAGGPSGSTAPPAVIAKTLRRLVGVVSKTAALVLGSAEESWHGRFQHAADGTPLMETVPLANGPSGGGAASGSQTTKLVQSRKQSPAYDPSKPYVPRSQRPEWHVVGLTGRVKVLKAYSQFIAAQQELLGDTFCTVGWVLIGADPDAPDLYDLWLVR